MPVTPTLPPLYADKTDALGLGLLTLRQQIIQFLKQKAVSNGANRYFAPDQEPGFKIDPILLYADEEVIGFTPKGLLVDSIDFEGVCLEPYETYPTDALYTVYEKVRAEAPMTTVYTD